MRRLIHMTWQELDALDREKAIIVMPIGSVEQHGPHLPLGTDFLLAEKLVEQLLRWEESSYIGIVLPVIQFGVNTEHFHFPGTICVPQACIEGIIEGQMDSMMSHGFSRFVLLNSHGGNISMLDSFIRSYRMNHDCKVTAFTYLSSGVYRGHEALFDNEVGLDIHAGEFETSIMQYFFPDLVKKAPQDLDECNLPVEALPPGWLTHEWSHSGVMGKPSLATSEKGRAFFQVADQWLKEKIELFTQQ